MFSSIKWRFTIIYFILIFVALITAGIFIVQAFEDYHIGTVEKKLDDLSQLILPKIESLDAFDSNEIQRIIETHQGLGFDEEIYIVNNKDQIIASSTETQSSTASNVLDLNLLIAARNGKSETAIAAIKNYDVRTMDQSMPIEINEETVGILFIRHNLDAIYTTLSKTTMIIVRAILLASLFTVFISFLIAKTISEPIEDIARKALLLGEGDFSNKVDVKSDDEIGDLARIFNVLTDKLRYNINEVFKEKNKMETIIEYMNDGLIAIDLQGEIIHINSKARILLKIDESAPLFSQINNVLNIEEILENETYVGIQNIQSGESILKIDYLPFEDDTEQNIGLVFVIRDITEREKLDRMRKEFVANVSHELKTPLTSIKSYSETLIDDVYDQEITKKFLNVINSEADRMDRLVRDLLQLSNFDASFADVRIENNDWLVLIENILLKLRPSYEIKNQQIDLKKNTTETIGQFDYDRMEQVMINIISNAIKYTPEGGIIEILLDHDEEFFIIKVIDNGMGIPESELQYIFDRFYRVNKARSRKLGGTGLGLSIAKEIVELHGGVIIMESTLNNGTTAIVKVPK